MELDKIVNELDDMVALDLETSGLDPYTSRLFLIQLNTGKNIYIIDCTKNAIKPLIQAIIDKNILVIGHNIKFDLKFILANTGLLIKNVYDTMIAESLIYRGINKWATSLSFLVEKYCGVILDKTSRDQFIDAENVEITDEVSEYAKNDVRYLFEIREKQLDVIENVVRQTKILELELKLVPVIAKMEFDGIFFDLNYFVSVENEAKNTYEKYRQDLYNLIITQLKENYKGESLEEIFEILKIKSKILIFPEKGTDEFFEYVGNSININSPAQIKSLLDYLGIKAKDTNKKTIGKIQHPFIESLLKYRDYAKLITSFTEPLKEHVNPVTKRIHCEFNQLGTVSGRFSASNPNLQQTDSDSSVRKGFRATKGKKFICADFSQQELRLLAAISQETALINAYKNNIDMHTFTASLLFDKKVEEVTKEERHKGKTMNFAVVYGASEYGIMRNFSVDLNKARELLNKVWSGYPRMKDFIEKAGNKILELGYSVTMLGRRRYFEIPKIFKDNYEYMKTISHIKRAGVNHIIQGTGADIIKLSLIELFYNNPFGNKFNILLTVHDEIVCEVDEDIAEESCKYVYETMLRCEQPFLGEIPAEVGAKISDYWAK